MTGLWKAEPQSCRSKSDWLGFMEKIDQNRYWYNSVTAENGADGSITINLGGSPGAIYILAALPDGTTPCGCRS